MTTTITGRNQITVPASLVAMFSLKPGTKIEWLPGSEADEFRCRVLPDPVQVAKSLRGGGKKYLKPHTKHPLKSLMEERLADDRAREEVL